METCRSAQRFIFYSLEKNMIRHESQRGYFAYTLHEEMQNDDKVRVLLGDLGWGMFNALREDYPDRIYNVGASEQAMMGIAVGMAQEGLKPFVYSITPFLLSRGHEWIRNYIDHEQAPVRLIGSGRDDAYLHDGFTHHAFDAKIILDGFTNIKQYFPSDKVEVPDLTIRMCRENVPCFISLTR